VRLDFPPARSFARGIGNMRDQHGKAHPELLRSSIRDGNRIAFPRVVMSTRIFTPAELSGFRAILISEERKLSSFSKDTLEALAVRGAIALDDQPQLMHDQFIAIHTRRNDLQKLRQIEVALDHISRGQFGLCQECGIAITRRRLEAIPWAAYCVPCQEHLQEEAVSKPKIELATA
jgi:RNA polymerase-binding transcription factor DksA